MMEVLNEEDVLPFLRNSLLYNERALVREFHMDAWPECSIGTKESYLDMIKTHLKKLKSSLSLDNSKPAAFNRLKRNFASFTKLKNIEKYEN